MKNIENAIRQALLKVDVYNSAMRHRVYVSAWKAQERFLGSQNRLSQKECEQKRASLRQLINAIEQEFDAQIAETVSKSQADFSTPEIFLDDIKATGPEDPTDINIDNDLTDERPDRYRFPIKHSKKTLKFTLGFGLTFCGIVVFILWSLYNSLVGPSILIKNQPRASIPPVTVDQSVVNRSSTTRSGWVRVFNPQEIVSLNVKGGAKAEIHNDGEEHFVRISGSAANDAVVIDLGAGTLNPLRGKTVTFDVVVRSSNGQPAFMTVECDLGAGESCGRRRFEVPITLDHLLFNVNLPANDNEGGKLFIASDILGKNKSIDIFSILVKAAI